MTKSIGVIGIGIMGKGMALNLKKAGYEVYAYNRTKSKLAPLIEVGIHACDTPMEVATKTTTLLTCVSDTPDLLEVVEGPEGILQTLQPGSLLIDCSTILPSASVHVGELFEAKGSKALDAPVSGGSEGAEQGTLSIMVGGDAESFARAQPVLEVIGSNAVHVGKSGDGQRVKLVNQILVTVTTLGLSEALVFAQAAGLDLDKTLAAVSGGAASSWMLSNRGHQILNRDWSPGFTIELQQKDLRLVLDTARELQVPLLGASTVHDLYSTLLRSGCALEGNHALVKAVENLAGVKVAE